MTGDKGKTAPPLGPSRRQFIVTTGAVAGAAAMGLPFGAHAATRNPKRGGTLRFAMRSDARGLDPHRNYYYYVSSPLAATSMGLMDYSSKMEEVPGIACSRFVQALRALFAQLTQPSKSTVPSGPGTKSEHASSNSPRSTKTLAVL